MNLNARRTTRSFAWLAASGLLGGAVSFAALELASDPPEAVAAAVDLRRSSETADVRDALESIASDRPALLRALRTLPAPAAGTEPAAANRDADSGGTSRSASEIVLALANRAAYDPSSALTEAVALVDALERRAAVARIGAVWAVDDPRAAIAAANTLPRDVRERYRRAVLEEWARFDVDAVIAFLETVDPDAVPRGLPLAPFLAADPQRMLKVAVRVPANLRRSVEGAALRAIARTDPLAAIGYIERQPAGFERDASLAEAAARYAELDPDAALRWARSLAPASRSVSAAVAATIADTDLERAVDIVLEWSDASAAHVPIAARVTLDSERARRLADELAARNDARGRALLDALVGTWSTRDAEAAFDWLTAHAEIADRFDLRFVVRDIAAGDPDAAARRIDTMPPALREEWAVQVAMLYAERDMSRVAEWLGRFRGEPAYDTAVGPIIARGAHADPRLTARLLEGASRAMRHVGSEQLAKVWAAAEPTAAAQWAEGITESDLRAVVVSAVAAAWAERDAEAAQRWLSGLPARQRDVAGSDSPPAGPSER